MLKIVTIRVAAVLLVTMLVVSPVHMCSSTGTAPVIVQLIETETNTLENELNVYHLFSENAGLDGIDVSEPGNSIHIYPSNDLLIEIPTPPPEKF